MKKMKKNTNALATAGKVLRYLRHYRVRFFKLLAFFVQLGKGFVEAQELPIKGERDFDDNKMRDKDENMAKRFGEHLVELQGYAQTGILIQHVPARVNGSGNAKKDDRRERSLRADIKLG